MKDWKTQPPSRHLKMENPIINNKVSLLLLPQSKYFPSHSRTQAKRKSSPFKDTIIGSETSLCPCLSVRPSVGWLVWHNFIKGGGELKLYTPTEALIRNLMKAFKKSKKNISRNRSGRSNVRFANLFYVVTLKDLHLLWKHLNICKATLCIF